ncbi:glucose 1-dehydrogenase [Pseudarthrobacter sp. IC2-21]|uniref:SDR family NAD(P)-dependent oxidoreductase n=1 Tax=Pseudarthrobacter sp. IC2-21 TaxID=3092262 RepID=UPI002A6A92E3|nr:glucose 1-dehydrogenase [Pseudarthrobacter sp. IC2-21]
MAKLKDFSVLITGGAGEIGAATAAAYLYAGARVTLVDIDEGALQDTRATLSSAGDLETICADVSVEKDVAEYVQRTLNRMGRIDVFFNNAGLEGTVAPLIETEVTAFDRIMAVNVRGAFLGLKYVLPPMIDAGRGSIINTSSTAGLSGSPGVVSYVASKHALVGLTKVAALEAAPFGVRVNSIHPSPVDTRMMRALEVGFNPGNADAAHSSISATIPLGHYATPRDVANLVLFLGSDDSSFITGAQYRIDGGRGAS